MSDDEVRKSEEEQIEQMDLGSLVRELVDCGIKESTFRCNGSKYNTERDYAAAEQRQVRMNMLTKALARREYLYKGERQ